MTAPAWDGRGTDPWLPARLEARVQIAAAERSIRDAVWAALSAWVVKVARAVLRNGGRPDVDAVWTLVPAWQAAVQAIVTGPILELLGSAYRTLFGDDYPWDQRAFVVRYLAEVENRLVRVPDQVFDLIASDLAEGINLGEGIPELSRRVDASLSISGSERWPNRATVIARTETIGAMNAGRSDAFAALIEMEPDTEFETVWLCVLPDTPVVAAGVRLMARRWYDGEVWELRTASGRRVSLTPEHPVLTTEGWLPAKRVQLGHQLLSVPIVDPIGAPDVEADHASIEQHFNAAAESGEVRTLTREMTCGVHLHGDLTGEKVDVVSVASDLTSDLEPSANQDFLRLCLELPDQTFARLVVERAVAHGGIGNQVGSADLTPTSRGLQFGLPVGSDDTGLVLVPDVHPGDPEHPADGISTGREPFGEGVNGLSPLVALDNVVGIEVRTWSGHVYDLTTSCHWFLADGIVVHNSTDDRRTRHTHNEADGQRVPVGQPFTVGGFDLRFPGDPSGPPQEVIQCRCVALLVERGESVDMSNRQMRRR